ncbi:hypothetical protein ZEAMMB73_Zm00001d016651 [Zea mays]|uniref:Uncharacterized protein n=1 Tax=Zea mays TaxID=4577 RepID=A0A1D6H9I6_MAIZE|nr:hypothetical protein ZEAMMB73_Zm00001d016651 [Zea mays]
MRLASQLMQLRTCFVGGHLTMHASIDGLVHAWIIA